MTGREAKSCPICKGKSKVIESRVSKRANRAVRRRHKCLNCGYRYNTIEIPTDYYDNLINLIKKVNATLDALKELNFQDYAGEDE